MQQAPRDALVLGAGSRRHTQRSTEDFHDEIIGGFPVTLFHSWIVSLHGECTGCFACHVQQHATTVPTGANTTPHSFVLRAVHSVYNRTKDERRTGGAARRSETKELT